MATTMTAWRRHLHQRPELGFECHQTAAFVVEKLRSFADLTVLDGETDPQRVLDRCLGMDALICTLMTKVSADFVARLPESVRILATYSVGYEPLSYVYSKDCNRDPEI